MSETSNFIPTKASLLKNQMNLNYEEVVFVSRKPKKKDDNTDKQIKDNSKVREEKGFNVRQVKNEIMKFGISGFDPVKKEEAKIQLAIKLGAKPPKNKYKNYKQLLTEKRKDKEKVESQIKFQQLGKNSIGKSTAKGKSFDKKRKKNESILDIYGKVIKTTKKSK